MWFLFLLFTTSLAHPVTPRRSQNGNNQEVEFSQPKVKPHPSIVMESPLQSVAPRIAKPKIYTATPVHTKDQSEHEKEDFLQEQPIKHQKWTKKLLNTNKNLLKHHRGKEGEARLEILVRSDGDFANPNRNQNNESPDSTATSEQDFYSVHSETVTESSTPVVSPPWAIHNQIYDETDHMAGSEIDLFQAPSSQQRLHEQTQIVDSPRPAENKFLDKKTNSIDNENGLGPYSSKGLKSRLGVDAVLRHGNGNINCDREEEQHFDDCTSDSSDTTSNSECDDCDGVHGCGVLCLSGEQADVKTKSVKEVLNARKLSEQQKESRKEAEKQNRILRPEEDGSEEDVTECGTIRHLFRQLFCMYE